MLASRLAIITHFVHARLAHTTVACGTKRAWRAAVVGGARASAVSTHVAVHEVVCEAAVRDSRAIDSVGTRITRDATRAVAAWRAEVAHGEVGVGRTATIACCACATYASLPSGTEHTGRWFGHIVCLLSVQAGGACAIATRRPDSAGLAARALLIRLSARCTDVAQSADTRVAHRTVLARLLICRRLGSRSTLAAHSRSRQPTQAHTAGTPSCRRSAQCRRRTQHRCQCDPAKPSEQSTHTARLAVRLRARRTRRAHATRASESSCARQALCAGPHSAHLTRAAQHAAATGAGLSRQRTAHTRRPAIVRCHRHRRMPCTSRLIQQTPRHTECTLFAIAIAPVPAGQRAQSAPAPSVAHRTVLARLLVRRRLGSQQHTGCTLPLSPAHPGAHGWHAVMSSFGSVPPSHAAQVPSDPAKPSAAAQAGHRRAVSGSVPGAHASHTPPVPANPDAHGRHCCAGPHSAPVQRCTGRTVHRCPRSQSAHTTQAVLSAFGSRAIRHTPRRCRPSRLTPHRTAHTTRGSQWAPCLE